MTISRRTFLAGAAGGAAFGSMPTLASIYPDRPVRILVGFPAGSSPDIVARTLAHALSARLGQSFIVEPRPGSGSNIATELALRAEPDGYTLLLCSGSNAWNATLYDRLPFDFLAGAAPISGVYRGPSVLVIHPSVPAKTIAEFIAYAKSKPGSLNMASNGNGSVGHVYGSLFKSLTQVDMVHVPYRDNPLPDLLDGRTNVYFSPMGSAIEFIRAGRLRALGVTSAHRWGGLSDIPAIGEVVTGFEATGWMGFAAPRSTPSDVILTLNKAIRSSLDDTTVRKRISDLGGEPFPGSPEEFGAFMRDFTHRWGIVIREAGIKLG